MYACTSACSDFATASGPNFLRPVPVREDGSTDNQLAGPVQVCRSTQGQLGAPVPTWYPPFRPASIAS